MLPMLTVTLFAFCVGLAAGFNLDTAGPLVHRGPPDTYFGFSVAQHKDRGKPWLLVGAPLAQTEQPGVDRGGAVYKCSPYSTNACRQVDFDRTGSGSITIRGKQEQTDEKSGQWFGATVQSSADADIILACAPRYVYYSVNRKRRDPVGSCYVSRGSFTGFLEYSPCRTPGSWGYHRQGSCQAGFSAALSNDGKRMFIGAVGSWYWQGQVFSQDMDVLPQLSDDKELPLATRESPETDDDSYLGYSMTVGEFSGDEEMDVAVGMPKGRNLTGKVVVYTPSLRNVFNISGEQMGSYFGHSLATADVNGDGLDDIIIGAPLYTTPNAKDSSYEKGRIYIAYQDVNHNFEIKTTIDGTTSKARFGMALASLGDLNKDGFQDIAVGAPYDGKNGAGAVYIFNGGKTGLQTTASQVIKAEQMEEPGLKTFGYSLSGGSDLDSNEYPDLLIGAYASDRAVSLRGRPVVNVTATLKVDPENINLEDKGCALTDGNQVPCVLVSICLQYTGIGVGKHLNFSYNLKLDADSKGPPRMFLLYEESQTEDTVIVLLQKDSKYCKSIYVYLNSKLRDKLTPIKVEMEYDIFDSWPQVKAVKPILNKEQKNRITKSVQIAKNCGRDNKCIPDLKLTVKPNMQQYLIGSRKRLELDITVKNSGEDAFESMLHLFMPLDVNYVNINKSKLGFPIICTGAQPEKTGLNVLICDIGNPLPANKKINFAVILEPSSIVTAAPDFTFITTVNSSNPEEPEALENNEVVIGLPIRVEVNMTLNGASHPGLVIYNVSEPIVDAKSSELDIGPQVVHVYQVQNRGPSTIRRAQVTILWPSATADSQYLLYLLDQPLISGKGSCQTVTLDEVNPLRLPLLKDRKDHYPSAFENVLGDGPDMWSFKHNHTVETLIRTKRFYRPNKQEEPQDPKLDDYMTCGPRICTKIYCSVTNLAKGDSVLFTVRSRLWKETVVDIASPEFLISSKMVSMVTKLPYDVDPSYLPPEVITVTTQIHTIGLDKPRPPPLWIIILAAVGGLLLLSLLALLLYKCGFFNRKRPPVVASDSEPLSPSSTTNGHHHPYHWTKGDTSL